jgi:nicotinate-nucleotide adenylyltransferase
MRLCVFQGTFNPIHKIHLEIAKFAREYYKFDNILFIPAYIPPHKTVDKNLAKHRFNMVKLAISDFKYFNISDIEYKHDTNSYTFNTIIELYKKYDVEGKINFLIGTDAFLEIESWYRTDELKELLHFIVFKRTHDFKTEDFEFLKEKGYDFEFSPMDFTDVSSTRLRQNLRNGKSIKNLELPKVEEYIEKNGLYINR